MLIHFTLDSSALATLVAKLHQRIANTMMPKLIQHEMLVQSGRNE